MEMQHRKFNSIERRPRMLKDFLSENPNSCSSSGFKSLPRTTISNNVVSLTPIQIHHTHSSSSSSTSTFQSLIKSIRNNVSFFKITKSSTSMLSLPRSLSRKLSSKRRRNQRCKGEREIEIEISTVKIKDIIRWKSFRDLQPSVPLPPSPPFDFHHYVTESSTVTTNCSSGSNWSDGDFFTALWEDENDGVEESKKVLFSSLFVGKDSVEAFVGDNKEDSTCQDEQYSPVSVLQAAENEFSLFDQSLANIERRKQKFRHASDKFESVPNVEVKSFDECLLSNENSYYNEEYKDDDDNLEKDAQKIEEQDWVEERAKHLLHCVTIVQNYDDNIDTILLDFFREELSGNRNQKRNDEGFELEIMKIAEDWINESFVNAYDIVHVNKDDYIKEMDRRGGWDRFGEEQDELVLEIEATIFHSLIDDVLNING